MGRDLRRVRAIDFFFFYISTEYSLTAFKTDFDEMFSRVLFQQRLQSDPLLSDTLPFHSSLLPQRAFLSLFFIYFFFKNNL